MKQRLTKREIIALIDPVFRANGYDGASLEALAEVTGLTRGSLYHHFPGGKEEMAESVLHRTGASFMQLIVMPLKDDGSALGRFEAMKHGLLSYYIGDPPVCLMNSLTLGSGGALFHDQVTSAVTAWHDALTPLCDAARAHEIISQVQGSLILARVYGDRAVFDASVKKLKI